jgi:predicted nucleic acid-binding protein
VKYLLHVNALVALGFIHHEFHKRVAAWVRAQRFPPLLTCSITELGFVRVLAQAPAYALEIAQAKTLLLRLKKASALSVTFISDGHDISQLPAWVVTPLHTTDGHLAQLARSNGAVLASLLG